MSCFASKCKNRKRLLPQDSKITFHRIPKGENYNLFLRAIGRPIGPYKPRFICSDHFLEDDFEFKKGKKFLKPGRLPQKRCETTSPSTSSGSSSPPSVAPPHSMVLRKRKVSDSEVLKFSSPQNKLRNESSTLTASSGTVTASSGTVTASSGTATAFSGTATASSSTVTASSPENTISRKRKSSSSLKNPENFPISNKKRAFKNRTKKNFVMVNKEEELSSSSSIQKKREYVKTIHNYSASPSKLSRGYKKMKQLAFKRAQKIYKLRESQKKLRQKIANLTELLNKIKEKQYLSDSALDYFKINFNETDITSTLIKRYLKNKKTLITKEKYPPILRKFAMTLQFYSSKAYNYVRETLGLALPHIQTIRKWCSSLECYPGFLLESLNALQLKCEEAKQTKKSVICSLIFDEIAIKKKLEFDGKKVWGHIDYGTEIENDSLEPATEALVLMVVSHNDSWKLPIAYFFIKSLNAKEKANIVSEALIRLHNIGLKITSVTCDGPGTHFNMFQELGCDWSNINKIKSHFPHPVNGERIYAIFDACHMLKLIRNNFANLKTIINVKNEKIEWRYLENLHNLQEQEGLKIVNKIKKGHIHFLNQKMKVNLACQILSKSVSQALEFLRLDLKNPLFLNSCATEEFLLIINNLFDILNSKNKFGRNYKAALNESNYEDRKAYLLKITDYLLSLKNEEGRYIWQTQKRTPILGFVITIQSILGIYEDIVKTEKLQYLLTYKCSQDHLELFFCNIRSRNGWNNNPTCRQFTYTIKRLLLHAKIGGKGGNCCMLDYTNILEVPSNTPNKDICNTNITENRLFNLDIEEVTDHDYDVITCNLTINEYIENVITYMSGYVIRMVAKYISCDNCLSAIISNQIINKDCYALLNRKNEGSLIIPTTGFRKLIKIIELTIRKILYLNNNIQDDVVMNIVNNIHLKIYPLWRNFLPTLEDHCYEEDIYNLKD